MNLLHGFLFTVWIFLVTISSAGSVAAAENRHEALRYSCRGQFAAETYSLEVYHDGAGGWGAPSSGRGSVVLRHEGIGKSDQRLIHEVYLRSSAAGAKCGLIAQFTEGDDIRFANFVLEIRESCDQLKVRVDGTLRITFHLEETEIENRRTPVVCQIH